MSISVASFMRFFFILVGLCGLWPAAALAAAPTILVYGDSLSAAYGIPREAGWPALLETRLRERDTGWRVVNASVSGETTHGGLTRLPSVLAAHRPRLTILALGANDGLRGLPPAQTARNLERMIGLAKKQGSEVLLVGMRLPPNYGPAYTAKFQALFAEVAKREKVRLLPFLLDGIATRPDAFLADGLHPNAGAQPALLDNVWKELAPMLDKARR